MKKLGILILFSAFFFGEIAISFSNKSQKGSSNSLSSTKPFAHQIRNDDSDIKDINTVDNIFKSFMLSNDIVGASVAVVKDGKLTFTKGYGFADTENNDSVTPSHLFRIASVSKLITAVAIMKLVEDKKLNVNQKVFGRHGILHDTAYLNYADKRIENITVHHLLSHTAGWETKNGDPMFNSLYIARLHHTPPPADMSLIIKHELDKELDYDPGKEYSYSNFGYAILGEIIEKVTGLEYEEYVQFAILHPLRIYDMHIGDSKYSGRLKNEVKYYDAYRASRVRSFYDFNTFVPMHYGGNNMELLGAAGGWVASAPELAKFLTAIDGFDDKPDILSKESIDYMTTHKIKGNNAIGWRGTDGQGTWWRTGTLSGTSALVMRLRNNMIWVVLTNTSTSKKSQIHNYISKAMFTAIKKMPSWPSHDLFIASNSTQNKYMENN